MITKNERQNTAVQRWLANGGIGVFWHVTGFGKTVTAIKAVNELKPKTVLVLSPREVLPKQWQEQLERWLTFPCTVVVDTVQGVMAKGVEYDVDLLIIDELHIFFTAALNTDGFSAYIDGTKVRAKHRLALTASYKLKNGAHRRWMDMWPVVDKITRSEAIQNEWVSPLIIYNLAVELTQDERQKYETYSHTISECIGTFNRPDNREPNGFDLVRLVLYGGVGSNGKWYPSHVWANALSAERGHTTYSLDDANAPGSIINRAKRLMDAIQDRKKLLETAQAKIEVVIEILNTIRSSKSKTILFSESTKAVDDVETALLNSGYTDIEMMKYHSNMQSQPLNDDEGNVIVYKTGIKAGQAKLFGLQSLKKRAIDNITNNPETWLLLSAKALDTGLDVDILQYGITISGRVDVNQLDQRIGRIIRLVKDKVSTFINVYYRNTIDELRVTKLINYEDDIIFTDSVDDIFKEADEEL